MFDVLKQLVDVVMFDVLKQLVDVIMSTDSTSTGDVPRVSTMIPSKPVGNVTREPII